MPTQKQPELKEKIEIPEGMCPCFDSKYDKLGDIEDICLLTNGEADIEGCHRKWGAASCPYLKTLVKSVDEKAVEILLDRAALNESVAKTFNQEYKDKAIKFYGSLR